VPWDPMTTVKGEVKGGGGEQFELLLVIIDDLEETRRLLTWFGFKHSCTEVCT
jgi:hypothetical protein